MVLLINGMMGGFVYIVNGWLWKEAWRKGVSSPRLFVSSFDFSMESLLVVIRAHEASRVALSWWLFACWS